MKAFLINPPTGLYIREDRCQSSVGDFAVSVIRPPMDLMMMAASLESKGVSCKITDYPVEKKGWDDFEEDFKGFVPDMLVMSVTTPTLSEDLRACAMAKKINPGVKTIAKGAHFLNFDADALAGCQGLDIVIRGECETVIAEIASEASLEKVRGISFRDKGVIKRNDDKPFIDDLDCLPLPARHLVRNGLYTRPDTQEPMALIEASRGCPGDCIFCLVCQTGGRKIRYRSPGSIADEMELCFKKYKIRNFHLKSDSFTWDKAWVMELSRKIIGKSIPVKWLCNSRVDRLDKDRIEIMKEAGLWAIGLGVESGNQDILDRIKKGTTLQQAHDAVGLCRRYKVISYAYFMIGFPWDTEKTVKDTIDFAFELDPDFLDFFFPYPFPGTQLEKIARDSGWLDVPAGSHAYAQKSLITPWISKDKLERARRQAMRRFYLRVPYIARTLLRASSPGELLNMCAQGLRVFNRTLR